VIADERAMDCPSLRWSEHGLRSAPERVSVEAPLAIEIAYDRAGQRVSRLLAVTMRTPGEDEDLAIGFLYCEGLIDGPEGVAGGQALGQNSRGEKIATWRAHLARPPAEDLLRVSRGFITSSACGLCGRNTLEGLRLRAPHGGGREISLDGRKIVEMPDRLRQGQEMFSETGGCHGAGLFDPDGEALLVREDVGRHNAVDKIVGAALKGGVPMAGRILVLSGRAGFELVQKAAAAGLAAVVAVGAPSSLAVGLAGDAGLTLIGFAREGRFNVYAHPERLAPGFEP
jgi:FdhD protein